MNFMPINTEIVLFEFRSYTTLYDEVCQQLATGWWFSPSTRAVTTIEANKAVASSDLEKKEKNNREREDWLTGIIFPAEKLHLLTQ